MRFLPFVSLVIETDLSPERVQRRLAGIVGSRQPDPRFFPFSAWFLTRSTDILYYGTVDESGFKIAPPAGSRNPFMPLIRGWVHPEGSGSAIHITMRPDIVILTGTILCLGVVGFQLFQMLGEVLFSILQSTPLRPGQFLDPMLCGGLFLFGYALAMVGFKMESTAARAIFRELFEETRSLERENRYLGLTVPQILAILTLLVVNLALWARVGQVVTLFLN